LGSAKAYAHRMTAAYRQRYGLKAGSGILFEHESPRRRRRAITRRITDGAARIKLGLQEKLVLSDLEHSRDWGFAGDYVRAFWMMLQHPAPDDFVIATGRMHSLEDFCKGAFSAVDLDWRDYVQVEPVSSSASPSVSLQGDASHARRTLLWEPEVSFREMIRMMVEADLERYSPKNRLQTDIMSEIPLQENCL
jgi:GDPmannose 4,6-dehydratase